MRPQNLLCLAFLAAATPTVVQAAADSELLELKNTIVNLVDALVDSGVLTADKATSIKREAALKAREQAAQDAMAAGRVTDAPPAGSAGQVVRVPYVPEFVRDEIREEVRQELRSEVTADVVATARDEGWGTPDALPDWVNRMNWFGDVRMRYQANRFDNNNARDIPFFLAINRAGGIAQAGSDAFLPTTEDTDWWRFRARFGFEVSFTDNFSGAVRIATGNDVELLTRNVTQGQYFNNYEIILDQGYLRYDSGPIAEDHEFTVFGGRLPNPFLKTDVMWDDDVVFEGIAVQYRGPFWGEDERNGIFVTGGVFPLLEDTQNVPDGSTNEKWLYSLQTGLELGLTENWSMRAALAYYDYENITGQRNAPNSTSKDWTAPEFLTKGNTVFDIRNDGGATNLFALAADFELVDSILQFTYTGFDGMPLTLTGNYIKNIGYDRGAIRNRTGVDVKERSEAWTVEFILGEEEVNRWGEWNTSAGYRYIQRDSVVDAFTDSNFHGSGTDGEGYVLDFNFGIWNNSWMRARWFSADEIDGDKLAVDIFQVDISGRF